MKLIFLLLTMFPALAADLPGDSIYQLKSKWADQDGKTVALSDLRGRPVVAAMAYTSCRSSCPWIVEGMKKVEDGIARDRRVSFVLFSFDSKRDTPAQLRKFAADHGLGGRWILLHGDAKSVRELAAALGVRYKGDAEGGFDHSNLVTVLDASGVVRYQGAGLPPPAEAIAKKLAELAP